MLPPFIINIANVFAHYERICVGCWHYRHAFMKKLLFFVTEDWYFVTHRLDLAVAAKQAGYDVTIVTQISQYESLIRDSGLNLVPISMSRRSLNIFTELAFIFRLYRIYKRINPDVVHNVTFKPVIYGTLVARLLGVKKVVNALAGLGFLFRSATTKAKLLKALVRRVLYFLLNSPKCALILQNPDDFRAIQEIGVKRNLMHLIKGAGVNTHIFAPTIIESVTKSNADTTIESTTESITESSAETTDVSHDAAPVVLLATRMLWDKGVGEFVEAAKYSAEEGYNTRFVLVGKGDAENPNSISDAQLQQWHDDGVVEWWGKRSDMPQVLNQADIVCLPSNYGEGIPKVLIEAASCAKAIVTTDTPGCREIVSHGKNGLLVPVEQPKSLYAAIHSLVLDRELREQMGAAGRNMVQAQFSLETVVSQTLELYKY